MMQTEHFEICPCCGKPKRPKQTNGRWPPNVLLSHVSPLEHATGCRRLGVKRVRGEGGAQRGSRIKTEARLFTQESSGRRDYTVDNIYDPDGTEPVTAWACALACTECGHEWAAEQRGACPECGGEARWLCPVGALGEQSGERRSAGDYPTTYIVPDNNTVYQKGVGNTQGQLYSDKGTAARFYPQFSWQAEIAERLALAEPFRYQAKSSRSERDQGLEGMMKLRDDLTQEQRQYVLEELERLGINGV